MGEASLYTDVDTGLLTLKWPDGYAIEFRCQNGDPNNPGGQHTNGPGTFWWRESDDPRWKPTFRSNEVGMRDLKVLLNCGLSRNALWFLLHAGARR